MTRRGLIVEPQEKTLTAEADYAKILAATSDGDNNSMIAKSRPNKLDAGGGLGSAAYLGVQQKCGTARDCKDASVRSPERKGRAAANLKFEQPPKGLEISDGPHLAE